MARDLEIDIDARDFLRMEVTSFLRRTQGRETFHCGPLPGFPDGCVVKRTRRDERDWMRPWRARSARAAGRREHENLIALEKIGVRVPRAVTWAAGNAISPSSECASVVVMERVRHTQTLRDALETADAKERARLGAALSKLVVRLHSEGFHHRDLYLQHVLVPADDGALVLIDVGRVARGSRARWLVKDLAALLHSTPARVTAHEKLRFAARWLDALGITGSSARRRWLRAIERKRARMSARVPRDERGLLR
jgi:tRNA A-37 threonylcarbamoyl transferase component Bud32